MLVRFASLTIEIHNRYAGLEKMCERYLVHDMTPDFAVSVTDEEIQREDKEGVGYPPAYLESLAVYRKIAREALRYHTFLFHGSVLEMDGEGYLFTAPSGTGKSTHTQLWQQVFGERVKVINDDKPLLTVREDGVHASGTPWDGKHRISENRTVKLRGICFLTRGARNRIVTLEKSEVFTPMLLQTHRPDDPCGVEETLALLDAAIGRVDFYRLECNISPEAAEVAYRGMKG